jgi:hypothetical protein
MWYKKYIAWNDAVAKLEELKSSNQWTLPETGQTELIFFLGDHTGILILRRPSKIFITTNSWLSGWRGMMMVMNLPIFMFGTRRRLITHSRIWGSGRRKELWIRIIISIKRRRGRPRPKKAKEMRKEKRMSLMTVMVKLRLPKRRKSHLVVNLNLESRLGNIACTCI